MSKATTVDFKIWEDRWDAVALLMKQMQIAMESTPQDGLSKTLKALQIFGEQQIDF